jgi:hypothetical protein
MTSSHRSRITASVLALALPFAAGPVAGQESVADVSTLSLDLNGVSQTESGCRLTFVVKNELAGDLDKAVFEFALFGTTGLVEGLLTLDFKELPHGMTRVRQFDLAEVECASLARILVNAARECSGVAVEPAACMRELETKTATDIEFGS